MEFFIVDADYRLEIHANSAHQGHILALLVNQLEDLFEEPPRIERDEYSESVSIKLPLDLSKLKLKPR